MLEKKIKAMFRITFGKHIVVKNNSAFLMAKFHKAVSLICEDNLRSPYSGGKFCILSFKSFKYLWGLLNVYFSP